MAPLKNHRKKPKIEAKLESFMAGINKIKNSIISEGRSATRGEETEIQALRGHIKNLEEIKKVWLKPKKNDR